MTFAAADYKKHLEKEHKISPFSTYLKEIVYGGIDGIVTTFAVVAGFSGAQIANVPSTIPMLTVLLFGFANLFADGVSMGLGNFLSIRANQDVYKREKEKERREIQDHAAMELVETVHILSEKGFSKQDAETMAKIYSRNEDSWVEFMMRDELGMPNPEDEKAHYTSVTTFISFVSFGIIPLIPYVLLRDFFKENLFFYSITFTFTALCILGVSRWKVTRQGVVRSLGETVLLGGISSLVAYLVGTLFRA